MKQYDWRPHCYFKIFDTKVGNKTPNFFVLPESKIPPPFYRETYSHHIIGYFISFTPNITADLIFEKLTKKDWQFLFSLWAEFLLVVTDKDTGEIFILSDLYGRLPCYFSLQKDYVSISTDIGLIRDTCLIQSLNLSAVLEHIAHTLYLSSSTLIREIHQAPPGCVIRICHQQRYFEINSVSPQMWSELPHDFPSEQAFLNEYINVLEKTIEYQMQKVGSSGLRLGAQLSSGLDSSLISYLLKKQQDHLNCYFLFANIAPTADDPTTAIQFAEKHNLEVKLFDGSQFFPFSHSEDYQITQTYPANINPLRGLVSPFHEFIAKDKVDVVWSGEGGNELYRLNRTLKTGRYFFQLQFFEVVNTVRQRMGEYLTQDGFELLISRENIINKKVFPSFISPSTVKANWADFSNYWAYNLWTINPFQSPAVINFVQNATIKSKPILSRKSVLRRWVDKIYLDKQFTVDSNYDAVIAQMFMERLDFVTDILQNSVLADLGLIKNELLLQRFRQGDISHYYDNGGFVQLHNLIRTEYFIQTNNLHIPTLS